MASKGAILHLFGWDKKFAPPFIDFVGENFANQDHRFIVYGKVNKEDLPQRRNIIHYPSLLKSALPLMAETRVAQKIILHGLFHPHLVFLLSLQPWLLKRCYWTIWGGDLYVHEDEKKDWRWRIKEWNRRFVISRLGHFITYIRGDYDLAQQWYGAKGQWHECFMYSSNIYRDFPLEPKSHDGIHILLGNSASTTNNHFDAFERLRPFADKNIKIYCPLSYGSASYGDSVACAGKEIFGENFIPLRDFMPFDKYLSLLSAIDIAIFNHDRQQGMGNIITLLGLGKSVYIRNNLTSWKTLKLMGINIFDINNIPKLSIQSHPDNKKIIATYFSIENLIIQWRKVFQ